MLDNHLIVKTRPQANQENIVTWRDYRVTVLQNRLFRLEKSEEKRFRDEATQSVWYRDMPAQAFTVTATEGECAIQTDACTLVLKPDRENCYAIVNGVRRALENAGNLLGTARTLDGYDGDLHVGGETKTKENKHKFSRISLCAGVCSKTGVAVISDESSLTLSQQGKVLPQRASGSDEYIFVYEDDYRAAVRALYLITGSVPLIPRFALGNWWSRYYVYTDKEYLRLLNLFDEHQVPLTVATIDMDWHYSKEMEEDLGITAKGRNTPFYGGNNGWTGYSWNKRLFPDYKTFLQKIKDKNLKITLNLHPADGVRWWEDCYNDMATALGKDPSTGEHIQFDVASDDFINAYFSVIHKPYEADGVGFWWIDWQQGENSTMEGLDPLWALNHYHYLDNAKTSATPLILSRYCGVGAHRYPLGFSGDTHITWDTLDYLPYFTATASNVGYTWWSHDIGGHMFGEKDNEQYLRHVQFGVFSPVNRLHCCDIEVCTKEPWVYGNGAGEIAKQWLRLRHQLIPYLYTASYRTHSDGTSLIEPLYYEWNVPGAYKYKNQYRFGSELLVIPITKKMKKDGFAWVKAWLPKGKWTDIFTGTPYEVTEEEGKEVTLLRQLESIPVLIKEGGILPLSLDKGNAVTNPEKMEISVYAGNGEYTLYEDGGRESDEKLFTKFTACQTQGEAYKQTLTISSTGSSAVIPEGRTFTVKFKDIDSGKITLYKNGEALPVDEVLTGCVALNIAYDATAVYTVEVEYTPLTKVQTAIEHARRTLIKASGNSWEKSRLWKLFAAVKTMQEYVNLIETEPMTATLKACLKEIL